MGYDLTMKTALAIMILIAPVVIQAKEATIYYLETREGVSGQTMDEFARSIRKRVSRLSHRNSAEVCGAIYLRDGRYGVDLVTTKNDMDCNMETPEGFTGVTIHTHPVTSPGLFSDNDYAAGEGYLVVTGNLYHQNGKGTVRKLR